MDIRQHRRGADGIGEEETMKRILLTVAVLGVWGLFGAGSARAQGLVRPLPLPGPRSPVSPFLNLNRGGLPAVNYFDLVRPQIDTANYLQQLQAQQTLLGQAILAQPSLFGQQVLLGPGAAVPAGVAQQPALGQPLQTPLITGHPARFFSYGQYYNYNLGVPRLPLR
jgi:hypothetical protein